MPSTEWITDANCTFLPDLYQCAHPQQIPRAHDRKWCGVCPLCWRGGPFMFQWKLSSASPLKQQLQQRPRTTAYVACTVFFKFSRSFSLWLVLSSTSSRWGAPEMRASRPSFDDKNTYLWSYPMLQTVKKLISNSKGSLVAFLKYIYRSPAPAKWRTREKAAWSSKICGSGRSISSECSLTNVTILLAYRVTTFPVLTM